MPDQVKPQGCIETNPTSQTVYLAGVPINLSEIARQQRMDQGYLSRIFSRQAIPSLKYALKISRALEMGLEDFLNALDVIDSIKQAS